MEEKKNNVMYLSIDIGEGIWIGDVDQPNVLLAFEYNRCIMHYIKIWENFLAFLLTRKCDKIA